MSKSQLESERTHSRVAATIFMVVIIFVAHLLIGCATIKQAVMSQITNAVPNSGSTTTTTPKDAVPFDSLVWDFGGFKPSSSTIVKGNISSVSFNGGTLNYSATVDPDWGKEGGAPNATIAALFFKGSDGVWRGGKFDWIGFVGKPRPAGHIAEYNGWAHAFPVPKGEEYLYLLIRGDNKRYRTNIIEGVVK